MGKEDWMDDRFTLEPMPPESPQINESMIVPISEIPGLDMPGFPRDNGEKSALFIELLFSFAKGRKILDLLVKHRDLNPIGPTSNCQIESSRF
jgi:hypothetical protein